jgi:predicted transcriptional regulator
MREHMSITVPEETAKRLRNYARRERRPVSQVVEIAIEELLERQMSESDRIVTSKGSFAGCFSREDSYGGR